MKIITQRLIFLLFFISVEAHLFAQKAYQGGYIIDNNNDTIYGKVKDRIPDPFGKLYKKIRFKASRGLPMRFSPNDIKGYKKGNEEYISMWYYETTEFFNIKTYNSEGYGNKEFFKIAAKGYLSYYYLYYEDEDGINYKGYFKRDGYEEMVFVRTGIFGLNKKRLAVYFNDCTELKEMIESRKIKDPFEILYYYNKWYKALRNTMN